MKMFDGYEISPVVENLDHNTCVAYKSLLFAKEDEKDTRKRGGAVKPVFWTIYGISDGMSEAISDFETEQGALDMLFKLTGIIEAPTELQHIVRLKSDSKMPRFSKGGAEVYDGATAIFTVMPPIQGIFDKKLVWKSWNQDDQERILTAVLHGLNETQNRSEREMKVWVYTEDSDFGTISKPFGDRVQAFTYLADKAFDEDFDPNDNEPAQNAMSGKDAKAAFLAGLASGETDEQLRFRVGEHLQASSSIDSIHVHEHTVQIGG